MELFFLALLLALLAFALGSGYPVAFAIPGSAILTVALAALCGFLFAGDVNAYFIHGGGPYQWLSAGVTNLRGIYRSDESDTLIAIPLFVFMGLMLQRSKVAEDLLLAMAQLFGAIRGGLGISVILVGALLAATTGIVGATVIAMGMISLPTMLRHNYSKPLATGVIAATGTLGQMIPPSIVLLILVHQLTTAVNQASAGRRALYKAANGQLLMPSELDVFSVSAGEMFMGAFVPGLVLVVLYILYVMVCAVLWPHLAPAVTYEESGGRKLAVRVLFALVPPLALILLVLGSIIAGVATVNQAGAIGAAGATIMAGHRLYAGWRGAFNPALLALIAVVALGLIVNGFNVNLRKIITGYDVIGVVLAAVASLVLAGSLCWSGWRVFKIDHTLKTVVEETTKTTSLVFAILLGAMMLTAAFRGFGGNDLVRDFLQQLPGGFWGQFTIVMLIIFVLGFFLDFIEITAVVVPIVAPILLADPSANITAVWLGVMFAMNIQTSFLTPPFGFALFYLRGVSPPSVSTVDIYKGVVPFIAIQLLALTLVGAYPKLVNYLPTRVLLLSDSAPPTTNPRLQYCVEEYVSRKFEESGNTIRREIAKARTLDLNLIPKVLRDEIAQSFEKADNAFVIMDQLKRAERAVFEAATSYRPVLLQVRELERDARRIDQEISKQEVLISRAGGVVTNREARQAHKQAEALTVQRNALLAQLPAEWPARHQEFSAIKRAEVDARRNFRRTVDDAYRPVSDLLVLIGDVKKLKAIERDLRTLERPVLSQLSSEFVKHIARVSAILRDVRGTAEIQKQLVNAQRALRGNTPKPDAVRKSLAKAISRFEFEVGWRERAAANLLPQLTVYETAIAGTIGLRGRSRLPDHVAVEVAACSATPRDIFLNF